MFSDTYAPIDLARPWLKLKHCLSHGTTSPVWHGWSTSFYKAKPLTSHQSHPKRRGMINLVVVYQLWNHPRRELWMIYNPMWMISWTSWCFWSSPSERRLWQQMMRGQLVAPGVGGQWEVEFPYVMTFLSCTYKMPSVWIRIRYSTHFMLTLWTMKGFVLQLRMRETVFYVFGFIGIHWWYCKWLTLLRCPVAAFWCDLLVISALCVLRLGLKMCM